MTVLCVVGVCLMMWCFSLVIVGAVDLIVLSLRLVRPTVTRRRFTV